MRISRGLSIAVASIVLMFLSATAFAQNLTLGSWRTDDVAKVNAIIAAFNKSNPGIKIKFDPTNPPDYNATLRLQLENGTGPDIYYARSYSVGQDLFKSGYGVDLTTFGPVKADYSATALAPWTTNDGKVFAQPISAVSHAIYYNKDLFAKQGIAVPKTWQDLIAAAKKLKAANITPFANGIADNWDIYECLFSGIIANEVGGADGRVAYEKGKRPFNDAHIVQAFEDLKDLAPYLPTGFEAMTYNDAEALFQLGKAAMIFDGSWALNDFQSKVKTFKVSAFATPPRAGQPGFVVFHPDFGIAINPASKNIAAAKTFLTWLASSAGAKAVGDNLPGFFPMSKSSVKLDNELANTIIGFNAGTGQDARFTWPKLDTEKKPSGYSLFLDNANAVLRGKETPKQAADAIAAGLAQWYKPSM